MAAQAAQLAAQAVLIEALRVELEALRRQVGRDSSVAAADQCRTGPGAKAKAKPGKRAAGRQSQQSPDGQPAEDHRAGPGASKDLRSAAEVSV